MASTSPAKRVGRSAAAMLCLRNHLHRALRAASHLPDSSVHRLPYSSFSSSAAASPAQFVVEDYLVASCGLAPARALRASKYLSHLKSPANADAVRAFLADAGFAEADIASAIAVYPRILCSSVDKTLTPRVAQLLDMGLSPSQISRLLTIGSSFFHSPAQISRLAFYVSLLGSYDKVEAAIKGDFCFLSRNIDTVKLNIAFLQQCGLTCDDIADLYALLNVCGQRAAMITAKLESLEMALGYLEAKMAVRRWPSIPSLSEASLRHRVEFLRMEFGLEPSYIAHRPAVLCYSLERRMIPRHFVIHVL